MAARTFKRPVLIDDLTTETSQTWAEPNGTSKMELDSGPARVHRGDRWVTIDSSLSVSGSRLVPSAVTQDYSFSNGGSAPLVEWADASGHALSVSWPGVLPAPVIAGSVATYPNAEPGVDVVLTALATGFDVSLRFTQRPAAGYSKLLPWKLQGMSARDGAHGFDLTDVHGRSVLQSPTATMSDAVPDDPAHGHRPHRSTMTVVTSKAGMLLKPDEAFLNDPGTVYPVLADPQINPPLYDGADLYTSSQHASTAYYKPTQMTIGNDGLGTYRSYLAFSNWTAVRGLTILDAYLQVWETYSSTCATGSTSEEVDTYTLGSAWTYLTDWANQPTMSIKQGHSIFVHNGPAGACGPSAYDDVYNTGPLIAKWANYTDSTGQIGLRAADETTVLGYKHFNTAETGNGGVPALYIDYNTPPGQGNAQSVQVCAAQCASPAMTDSAQPQLSGWAHDADGNTLRQDYEVWQGNSPSPSQFVTSGSVSNVASDATGSWVVPSTLADGTYEFRMRAFDSIDYGAWSSWFVFTVDTVPPAPGTVSSTSWPRSVWSNPTSGSFSWTPGDGTVNSYSYSIDGGATVLVPASTTSASIGPLGYGWHSFQVWAYDVAGNQVAYTPYQFGIGAGALTSPLMNDRTSDSIGLGATAPSTSYTFAQYQWAKGTSPTPTWSVIPAGSILTPGTSTPATATGNSTYALTTALTWKAMDQLRAGALEVRACFAADGTTAPGTTCTGANMLTTVPAAFGPSYATTPVGPGTLALKTGDLSIDTPDVNVRAYDGSLTLGRTLTTMDPFGTRRQLLPGYEHDIETDLSQFVSSSATVSSATTPTILGAHSLALAPSSASPATTDTFVAMGGDTGALRLGMQPGHTYTLSGMEYVPSSTGLSTDFPARGEKLVAFTQVGSAGYTETQGTAPSTVDRWSPVSVTFRVPDGATEAFVRLYNGFSTGKTGSVVYYDDFTLAQDGIFGPAWTASLPGPSVGAGDMTLDDESASGYVVLTGTDGSESVYTQNAGSSPSTFTGVGDANDGSLLTQVNGSTYTLTDSDGTVTTWTGLGNNVWQVQSVRQAASDHLTSFTYDGDGRVTQILGPVPPGVSCANPLTTVGCRTLTLSYATATTAAGTAAGTWGNYVGDLATVSLTAADPQNGNAMTTSTVAQYAYDNAGWLRQEWDPRLSSPLKTTYTYGLDGRLTTLAPSGLNAFTFAYDSQGRLSSASRPDPAGGTDTQTVVYDVPLSGTNAPVAMDSGTTASWGQTSDLPQTGVGVFPASHPPAGTTPATVSASDWPYASLAYLDADGHEVNAASYGAGAWQVSTSTYDQNGNVTRTLSPRGRDEALNPGSYPAADPQVTAATSSAARAALLDVENHYSDDGVTLLSSLGPVHPVTLSGGTVVDARDHQVTAYDEGAPTTGGPYRLPTTKTSTVQTPDGVDHDARVTRLGYAPVQSGDASGWTLRQPTSTTIVMPSGQTSITHTTRYDAQGRPIATWMPSSNGQDAGATVTSYYSGTGTGSCASVAMAGMPCSTAPAAQPSSGPALPVTTVSYDRYDNPISTSESANGVTRTTSTLYDPAERACLSTITVSGGSLKALPPVYTQYDPSTGLPTSTGNVSGAAPAHCSDPAPTLSSQITTRYDSDGRANSYSDADGNTSTVTYTADGQVATRNDGKGSTSYSYDSSSEHRGLLVSQSDSQAGSFTASYDAAGQAVSKNYPSGLTATTTYDDAGQPAKLVYAKGSSTWMTFTAARNAQGQIVSQTSPGSSQTMTYDNAGRLSQVNDSVTSSAQCTTRTYGYDLDSNRTSQVSYAPASTGACSTSTSATSQSHSYDQADRITDPGYSYDALGNTSAFIEAPTNGGTGADGDLTVDGSTHPSSNPLLLAGTLNYRTLSLTNGGSIAVQPGTGGVLTLNVQGTLNVCSTCSISADGQGGSGAPAGSSAPGQTANGGSPGQDSATYGGGGGGGGNASAGANGRTASGPTVVSPGAGGAGGWNGPLPSNPGLTSLVGGGGAAGGNQTVGGTVLARGGAGGNGGGVLRVNAQRIADAGHLSATGYDGGNAQTSSTGSGGGGGGGGGGAVWLNADSITVGNDPMTTCCSWVGWGPQGNSGGQGGGGYVRYDTASVDNPSAASVRTSPQLGTLTYWANDMAASNTVSGVTNSWTLDPATRQHTETFGATGVTTTNHYADGGDSPAWTSSSDASWSRNIPGIDGQLAAINDSTGRSELQLTNLHGDVVANAPNSSTATGVDSYSESTEFGAPRSGTSPKYGWLGGHQRATDTLNGLTLMGQRLYNPLSGRFLQTDPIPGGSANAYDYVYQDPINKFDLTGQCWGFSWKCWKHKIHAVATVASYASFLPGPLGTAASGIAAVGYLASGDMGGFRTAALGTALGFFGGRLAERAAGALWRESAGIGLGRAARRQIVTAFRATVYVTRDATFYALGYPAPPHHGRHSYDDD